MPVVPLIFGWPAIVASIAVTIAGIALRRPLVTLAGAIMAAPFMFYLFASPRFRLIAPLVACGHFAAAYALNRYGAGAATALFLPFVLLAVYLALLVVGQ